MKASIEGAIARLSREDRKLYELRFRQGLGWKHVAVELGISARTAQYRAEEIRDELAAAMRAYGDDG